MSNEEMLGMLPCKNEVPGALACSDENAEEIGPESEVPFNVTGGVLPLSWEITGPGLTLGNPAATGRTNSVVSDDANCGMGQITVTDDEETKIDCFIRSEAGVWHVRGTIVCGGCVDGSGWQYYVMNPCHRVKYCTAPGGDNGDWNNPTCGFFDLNMFTDGFGKVGNASCERWE